MDVAVATRSYGRGHTKYGALRHHVIRPIDLCLTEPPGVVTPDSVSDPSATSLTVSLLSPRGSSRDNTVAALELRLVDAEIEATENGPPKKSPTLTHAASSLEEQHPESGRSPAASTVDLRGPWKSVNTEGNVSNLDRSVQNTGAHTRGRYQHTILTPLVV